MVQISTADSISRLTIASAKSFVDTMPDVMHQPMHEILDRIGITVTKWTVRAIFTELLHREHEIPTSISSEDMRSEGILLA